MLKKPKDNTIICRFCKQPITEGIYTSVDLGTGNYLVLCDDCKAKLELYLDHILEEEA